MSQLTGGKKKSAQSFFCISQWQISDSVALVNFTDDVSYRFLPVSGIWWTCIGQRNIGVAMLGTRVFPASCLLVWGEIERKVISRTSQTTSAWVLNAVTLQAQKNRTKCLGCGAVSSLDYLKSFWAIVVG